MSLLGVTALSGHQSLAPENTIISYNTGGYGDIPYVPTPTCLQAPQKPPYAFYWLYRLNPSENIMLSMIALSFQAYSDIFTALWQTERLGKNTKTNN